ncbi:hypothetical protein [Nonomuraea sp. NPDC023979]|uniref:hypothetical protein n=1 Tax=Nonomuraea sp. NPDC023979 TaxID=3154796 RepID=UPI0033C74E1E
MAIPLLERRWHCTRCPSSAVTRDGKTPMHPCTGFAGLMVPLTREGVAADLRVVEREDYVGRELVQTDGNGRPVMAVVTVRDDGQDCTVYAPAATASREEFDGG